MFRNFKKISLKIQSKKSHYTYASLTADTVPMSNNAEAVMIKMRIFKLLIIADI